MSSYKVGVVQLEQVTHKAFRELSASNLYHETKILEKRIFLIFLVLRVVPIYKFRWQAIKQLFKCFCKVRRTVKSYFIRDLSD